MLNERQELITHKALTFDALHANEAEDPYLQKVSSHPWSQKYGS